MGELVKIEMEAQNINKNISLKYLQKNIGIKNQLGSE